MCFALTKSEPLHFFLDDYKFKAVYDYPEKYIARLKSFSGMLSPDFSLYTDIAQVKKEKVSTSLLNKHNRLRPGNPFSFPHHTVGFFVVRIAWSQ
jgi:hypothetical protein